MMSDTPLTQSSRWRPRNETLPKLALKFLRQHHNASDGVRQRAVHWFHESLDHNAWQLHELTPVHIATILSLLSRRPILPRTQQKYRYYLYTYLDWLFQSQKIGFDPRSVRQHQDYPKRLPKEAHRFLSSLTSLKPQSLRFYRTTLRSFYSWLDPKDRSIKSLTHLELTDWFNHNKRRGLKASTQVHLMSALRVYLRWCHEQQLIPLDGDDLIRPTDFPPVPSYLPRPLPIDVDIQLQRRLAQSENLYQQGLLLMRSTGLRIGELMALEYDCIRTDLNERHFLKVPLGKLNNERLVPLDDKTFNLIVRLQSAGPQPRTLLLVRPTGKPTRYSYFEAALHKACKGLHIPDKMNTHRLRHTYATVLLNGGMSLVGVMHLLGHRYIRTTLRYAAITQDTVVNDYFKAMAVIEKQYATPSPHSSTPSDEANPNKMLTDIARWLQKSSADGNGKHAQIPSLIKRILYIQKQIQQLATHEKKG
jgi:site-specific recombinase XerD